MPVDLAQAQHIRLRSGSENSSSKLAAFWAGAVLPISGIGAVLLAELRAAAATVGGYVSIVAGYLTLAGVVVVAGSIITGDTRIDKEKAHCREKYGQCIQKGGPNSYKNSGGWNNTNCNNCRITCEAQGYWPAHICPL
jgi:hypothetical protein